MRRHPQGRVPDRAPGRAGGQAALDQPASKREGVGDALRRHLRTFEEAAEATAEAPLPGFVRAELERTARCGVLAHGFLRVRCGDCTRERLVGFSCHGRGVCSRCGGRRMADTAARWRDHTLPDVPWRQWVLSLPFDLRWRLAWDAELLSAVLRCWQGAIRARLRLLARRRGERDARHAAVTVVQRFGGALNLNVHFHSLVADGVWVADEANGERPRFVPLKVRDADVVAVARTTQARVVKLMVGRDRRETPAPGGAVPPDRVPWAQLPYRVFLTDVLRCPDCGGRRSIIASVTDEAAAQRILAHLGLEAEPALLAPSRGPPGHDTWDEAADVA